MMKINFILPLCIFILSSFLLSSNLPKELKQSESKTPPVDIIFDTDIAGDYDDVGAMALLHAFADKGEVNILATISSNAFQTTIPTISVLNTYFGRPEIPCGITKKQLPNQACSQKWAEAIIAKYPHNLMSNDGAMDAVKLYRKILAQQQDHSVTIVTVGFFTNLADLLDSKPDEYSALSGKELVHKKVKLLISMAAALPEGKDRGSEYNVHIDAPSSQKVFSEWNTPFILSPFGIGEKIFTGIRLINNADIQNSPVKDAYQIALTADKNTTGRMSWDQTAVLVAARGYETYFNSKKLNLKIEDDGSNVLIPGEKFIWLTFKNSPMEIQTIIEDLMMHQPKVKK
jgi:inosine-uridine nucleoside N-ribohydrolase